MRRLFAALLVPDEVREHLVAAIRPVREEFGRELRWTDPDNWHLTLAFYGAWPNDPSELLTHLAGAGEGPLRLHLRGAGSFAGRTLWVGVGGDVKPLRRLMAASQVEEPEFEKQRAHLTVARVTDRAWSWAAADITRAMSVYAGPEFVADRITLLESFLGEGRSGGPRYEVVDEVFL